MASHRSIHKSIHKKANTKYQIKTSTRQNIAFYAAAQVAARPIARQRPAIIVIAFLLCTAIAIAPLKSLAIMLWGHSVPLSRLANMC